MIRAIGAALAGYAVWTVLWLGGNAVLFVDGAQVVEAGELYAEAGPLGMLIVLSAVCSLVGGALAARLAGGRFSVATWVLALALLGTGVPVQLGFWELLPLWYHLGFLVLLVPMTLIGARMGHRTGAPTAA